MSQGPTSRSLWQQVAKKRGFTGQPIVISISVWQVPISRRPRAIWAQRLALLPLINGFSHRVRDALIAIQAATCHSRQSSDRSAVVTAATATSSWATKAGRRGIY